MISRRLVSGIAATLLGAAGLATAASAMNSDSKPAVPHGTTAPNTATPDATISVADGQVDDSAPDSTDQSQVDDSAPDSTDQSQVDDSAPDSTDQSQVDGSAPDSTDQAQGGKSDQSDSGN